MLHTVQTSVPISMDAGEVGDSTSVYANNGFGLSKSRFEPVPAPPLRWSWVGVKADQHRRDAYEQQRDAELPGPRVLSHLQCLDPGCCPRMPKRT